VDAGRAGVKRDFFLGFFSVLFFSFWFSILFRLLNEREREREREKSLVPETVSVGEETNLPLCIQFQLGVGNSICPSGFGDEETFSGSATQRLALALDDASRL
jgi:hypothetical protein